MIALEAESAVLSISASLDLSRPLSILLDLSRYFQILLEASGSVKPRPSAQVDMIALEAESAVRRRLGSLNLSRSL